MLVDLNKAEEAEAKHHNLMWDGWDLILVNVDPKSKIDGWFAVSGVWFNNEWRTRRFIKPNSDGMYNIPDWYLK